MKNFEGNWFYFNLFDFENLKKKKKGKIIQVLYSYNIFKNDFLKASICVQESINFWQKIVVKIITNQGT